MPLQVLTDDDTTEGVTDEMDFFRSLRFTALYGSSKICFCDCLDRFLC